MPTRSITKKHTILAPKLKFEERIKMLLLINSLWLLRASPLVFLNTLLNQNIKNIKNGAKSESNKLVILTFKLDLKERDQKICLNNLLMIP